MYCIHQFRPVPCTHLAGPFRGEEVGVHLHASAHYAGNRAFCCQGVLILHSVANMFSKQLELKVQEMAGFYCNFMYHHKGPYHSDA